MQCYSKKWLAQAHWQEAQRWEAHIQKPNNCINPKDNRLWSKSEWPNSNTTKRLHHVFVTSNISLLLKLFISFELQRIGTIFKLSKATKSIYHKETMEFNSTTT